MTRPWDGMRLDEARSWLRSRVEEGETCPCCQQFAKIYPRTIHSTIARALIKVYNAAPAGDWVHLATVAGPACEGGKARYWGLMEEEAGIFVTTGRSGWWRLTNLGRSFVRGGTAIPKYAYVYDKRCLRVDGPEVTIQDCLGTKFSYDELMSTPVLLRHAVNH
jgi:hypothetical protein